MSGLRLARIATLSGLLGLLGLIPLWYGWLSPPTAIPAAVAVGILLLPLLAAAPGLLRARVYTHAWTSMLSLLYFAHGIGEFFGSPADRAYAALEVILAVSLYIGAVTYTRLRKRGTAQDAG